MAPVPSSRLKAAPTGPFRNDSHLLSINERFEMRVTRRYQEHTVLIALLFITISIACVLLKPGEGCAGERLNIYVVNYPLKYFAERIAGEHARVVFPAPADVDPVYWMPDAKMISDYQRADLILLNGANYAKWVNKVSLPRFRMVNTSAAFKDR